MVSSSSQRDTTRAPQQPDQLASFHSLVDKSVHAAALNRHARAVELSAKAAEKGEALFGDNSLVVANLRIGESSALASLAIEARGAEKQALIRRSWSALLSVIAILQLRLANNTLLAPSGKRSWTTTLTLWRRLELRRRCLFYQRSSFTRWRLHSDTTCSSMRCTGA